MTDRLNWRDRLTRDVTAFMFRRFATQDYRMYVTQTNIFSLGFVGDDAEEVPAPRTLTDSDVWVFNAVGADGVIRANHLLYTHTVEACGGDACPLHNPSNHPLTDAPMAWRGDVGIGYMERYCDHELAHPDVDDLAHKILSLGVENVLEVGYGEHTCDGCCMGRGPADAAA